MHDEPNTTPEGARSDRYAVTDEIGEILRQLSRDELARVDALAKQRGLSREEMIAELAHRGHHAVQAHAVAERRAGTSTARIRVEVAPAPSPAERWVMFSAEGRGHALLVDARDVAGELLRITVLREEGDQVLIELPRATIAGQRVKVSADRVLEEPSSGGRFRWALLAMLAAAGACVLLRALK
jgi:hypothetical protein